jgi:cyclopropane-fatty-acyl-phospholipid synthase
VFARWKLVEKVGAMVDAATRLVSMVSEGLGGPLPLRLRAWDGSEAGPPGAPTLEVRDPRALRRLLWRPGELGVVRAWVAGEIDLTGDLYAALEQLTSVGRDHRDALGNGLSVFQGITAFGLPRTIRLVRGAISLAGPGIPPPPPLEEVRRRHGRLHTLRRDREAISHHYDVGNDFFALILGPSMVYSCAYWDGRADVSLEDAQCAKLDLICRKLGLEPGHRLLDVGCGWGSMALHAAQHYGVHVVGITLSAEQAQFARACVAEAGLTDRVEIRVQDYRENTDAPFDAISSIGMAEHVGAPRYRAYAEALYARLKPGGRLLNQQISRRPLANEKGYKPDQFIDRYVFPDGELMPLGATVSVLEGADFEVRDVEGIREHYALTLRAWVANLEARWEEAVRLSSPGRARVWRLYMAASALAFERNKIGVNQVLAVRADPAGTSSMPRTRHAWPAAGPLATDWSQPV